MIQLRTLGTLALRDTAGEDLHAILAQPKRVALLVYLAVARPRGFHRRDTLLALLWPEQDEQHARWALNQALRHLRNALGKEVLPSRGDEEVGVDFGLLSCDAVEFEAALEADDPARALELYQGDLLAGFHVSGCGEFERWLEEERGELRRRAARAAALLATRKEAAGEQVAAGHWARRAVGLAPDDESEIRNLIRVLDRLGDRAGAIEAYESFARRLSDDYEAEPAPETRAAIMAVRARQRGATPAAPPTEHKASAEAVTAPAHKDQAAPAVRARQITSGRRRKTLVLATAVLALLAAGSLISGPRTPPPAAREAALPRNTIAVLPFAYRGSPGFAYLGEGLVDLLSANLNGAGEIQTVSPGIVLGQLRQANGDRLTPEQARSLAARVGAGSYVVGNVMETGGRLRISARLEPGDPNRGDQAQVDGSSSQLFGLVDHLTAQLIAQQSGGAAGNFSRLAALTTDSLSALKVYLQSERFYRLWKTDSAFEAVKQAVRIDTSFALAHYRLASLALWIDDPQSAQQSVDRALRFGPQLGERNQRLLGALDALARGRVVEAEQRYREIITRDPDDLEANWQLGELLVHRSGQLNRSWLEAREPLERVLAIEPGHKGALYHLSNVSARERRLAELDSLTERILQMDPTLDWVTRAQRAVVFQDTAEIARFMAAMRRITEDQAQPASGFVVFTTGDLELGRPLWRMLTEPSRSRGVRTLAHVTLAKIEVMTGRWRAAKLELEAAEALDSAVALEYRALLSLWPLLKVPRSELLELRTALLKRKAAPRRSAEASLSAHLSPAHPYLRLYLLGLLNVRLGEPAAALGYAAELDRRSARSFDPVFVTDWARTVRAEASRARGRLPEALAMLDSVGPWTFERSKLGGLSPFFAQEYRRFARAEVLFQLERYQEALQAYRSIADELFHSGAPAHFRLAEIHQRLGQREKAVQHYSRFVELWKGCDPELRSILEEARRQISG